MNCCSCMLVLVLAWCFVKVLGSLRQRIQAALVGEKGVEGMVREAQRYLLEREDRLVNARRHALEAPASLPSSNTPPSDPFDRGKTCSCRWEFLHKAISSINYWTCFFYFEVSLPTPFVILIKQIPSFYSHTFQLGTYLLVNLKHA